MFKSVVSGSICFSSREAAEEALGVFSSCGLEKVPYMILHRGSLRGVRLALRRLMIFGWEVVPWEGRTAHNPLLKKGGMYIGTTIDHAHPDWAGLQPSLSLFRG